MTTVDPTSSLAAPSTGVLAKAAAVGFVAGFLSGIFGVGGGILIVPALVIVMGMDQRIAHGTSLAAVLPIAVSGTVSYGMADKIDWPVAALLAVGAVAGAVVGTHVLHHLPERALGLIFAALLIVTAVRLVVDDSDALGRGAIAATGAASLVVIGVLTGLLAGLLGVGGGIVMVPAMVVGFGIPAAVAKGTSLAVIVPTSIMGTWRNRKKRNANLPIAAAVGLAGVASAFVAGKISVGMSESTSNVLFAVLLTVVAVRMLWQMRREHRQ